MSVTFALFDPVLASRKQSLAAIAQELQSRLGGYLQVPGFAIGRHEGYRPGSFGARAGFQDDMSAQNVLHELAHAVELLHSSPTQWKRRLGFDNFNLRIRSYQTVAGQKYYEPVTTQSTERECRVGAIQLHLMEQAGYDTSDFTRSFVRSLRYMSDSYLGGDSILNTESSLDYTPQQQQWVALRTMWVESQYAQHSAQSIRADIALVCEHLSKKNFDIGESLIFCDPLVKKTKTAPTLTPSLSI